MGRAQTASEYIVLLAVVIFIAGLVVWILVGTGGTSSDTPANTAELQFEEIGITNYKISSSSTTLRLTNNGDNTRRVTQITVNNVVCDYSGANLIASKGELTVTCSNINADGDYDFDVEVDYSDLTGGGSYTVDYSANLVGKAAIDADVETPTTAYSGDTTAPSISTLSPVDDATNVGITSNLVVTFDENVAKGTGNIVIYNASVDSIIETIAISSTTVSGSTVTINPSDFAYSSSYYVQIAATAIDDVAGNSFAGVSDKTTWNFATVASAGDGNAPTCDTPLHFSGGSGTIGSPYQIGNCTALQQMRCNVEANYTLISNIDCSDTVNWNSGAGFDPVGNLSAYFEGKFDGAGYDVSDLYINRPSTTNVGLIGYAWAPVSSIITNVTLSSVNVTGGDYVGGFIGSSYSGQADTISVEGFVNGTDYVGGIIGFPETLDMGQTKFVGTVTGVNYVGGIAGGAQAVISNSYVNATITGTTSGGLLGNDGSASGLANSYFRGSISGDYIGGLAGHLDSDANLSFSVGTLSEGLSSHGIVYDVVGGRLNSVYWYNQSDAADDCYSIGNTNCTLISSISDMYDNSNAPLSSWDFANVWGFLGGTVGTNYPCLLWEDGCSAP